MIKKVLIATDGSSHAEKAVIFGSDIAAKYNAEVLLVHVLLRKEVSEEMSRMVEVEYGMDVNPLAEAIANVPEARFPADIVFAKQDVAEPRQVLRFLGERILKQAGKTAHDHGVEKVSKHIEDGNPVSRILELAKAEDVDLIVSGARGLSNLKALFVGSVSHKLLQLSPVTCITVR
jgi:nucleotide-binding universal stress UspA family protein